MQQDRFFLTGEWLSTTARQSVPFRTRVIGNKRGAAGPDVPASPARSAPLSFHLPGRVIACILSPVHPILVSMLSLLGKPTRGHCVPTFTMRK
jgi:hypothetical protein